MGAGRLGQATSDAVIVTARRPPLPLRRYPSPVASPATRRHASQVARASRSHRAVLPRQPIPSPRKLPVKGAAACGLRVPALRSGQTLDYELPRQDLAAAGRAGQAARVALEAKLGRVPALDE